MDSSIVASTTPTGARIPLVKLLGLLATLGAVVALLFWVESLSRASGNVQMLTQADFALSADGAANDKLPTQGWAAVTLPDNWSRQRREAQGIGWYRLGFVLPADNPSTSDVGLTVKRLSMAAEFYLNGHLLSPPMPAGEPQAPAARMWNTPQYRALPRDWLRPGHNEIAVRLYSYRDYNGGLGAVAVGPDAAVYRMYRESHFLHSTTTAAATVVLTVMGLMALAIGLRFKSASSKTTSSPLYLGLSCLLWAVWLLNNFLETIPLSWFWWGWPMHSLGGWVPVLMLMYCHRYMGMARPRLERVMLGYTLLCTLLIGAYLADWISKGTMAAIWLPFNIATNIYMLMILWRLLRDTRSVAPFLLAAALAFFVATDVHDRFIVTATFENWVGFDATYWRPVSALLLSFAFCLLVADQLVQALQEARLLNRDLELRVQQKSAELQANFERLGEVQKRHTLLEERNRIMRDLHDGVGGEMVSAIKLLERGQISTPAAATLMGECLDSLRLVFDSAGEHGADLVAMLGNLRWRIAPRLAAAGIALELDTAAADAYPCRPEVTLQVMRIVQEGITNAVKHAQCTRIALTLDAAARSITVADNGKGFDADLAILGRGLNNQQHRARSIGASVQLTSAPTGTQLVVSLPAVIDA